jgi:hypothetical protein
MVPKHNFIGPFKLFFFIGQFKIKVYVGEAFLRGLIHQSLEWDFNFFAKTISIVSFFLNCIKLNKSFLGGHAWMEQLAWKIPKY